MIKRRARLGTLAATTVARAEAGITIRFGFANAGVDSRHFSGGNYIATAHAEPYIDIELK